MMLRTLPAFFFSLLIPCVGPGYAVDAEMAAGDKAVTVSAVTLDIVQNGRKAGSPDRAAVPPFRHDYIEGQCNCCRDLRHGELLGWYAELLDGGKLVDKTQSSMNSNALSALQDHLAKTQ
jgi:hypothetical protein